MIEYIIAAAVGIALGAIVGHRLFSGRADDEEATRLRAEGERAAEESRREAEAAVRRELAQLTQEAEATAESRRLELRERSEKLQHREESVMARDAQLSRQEAQLARRDKELSKREKRVDRQEKSAEEALSEARAQLEAAAALSPEEAQQILLAELRDEAREKGIEAVRAVEREARAMAEERARMIVSAAIQRFASEHVADRTVTTVALPSEDMKGRIIGREGRNIRAFEAATGCDLVIDESPETVVISSFNPVRREIGRLALERLLADGRIHPARIEEVVERISSEMKPIVRKYGETAALELEITGLHPELIQALGRLNFATSFAQNVLRHSVEVGFLAGMMASELGLDPRPARRAGLLHDVGKAVDQEAAGSHAEVGAALCRRHGESKEIVDAIAHHHELDSQKTLLAQLVGAANRLSASRPGARREALASYIKRLEDLEALVNSFEGVESCFALQSGSEIRVLVDNARLSDRDAELLARDIARRIEQEVAYTGEVRVTVIRATRAVQYAR